MISLHISWIVPLYHSISLVYFCWMRVTFIQTDRWFVAIIFCFCCCLFNWSKKKKINKSNAQTMNQTNNIHKCHSCSTNDSKIEIKKTVLAKDREWERDKNKIWIKLSVRLEWQWHCVCQFYCIFSYSVAFLVIDDISSSSFFVFHL